MSGEVSFLFIAYPFLKSSSTVGADSLYLKRRIFWVAVFSKGSFMTSTELTCEDLFTFLLVMLNIFFQLSIFSYILSLLSLSQSM